MPTWQTGYSFPGYTPAAQPNPDPPAESPKGTRSAVSEGQRQAAKGAGASHIASDGYYCYRWSNSRVESKQWYGERYSMNWMDTGKDVLPEGAVKVE